MRLSKTITPLLWRVIVFLCLFVLISGIVGPKIIGNALLFHDGFAIYGGVGKAMIFGLIAFLLLVRHRNTSVALQSWHPALLCWLGGATTAVAIAWADIDRLLGGRHDVFTLFGAHAGLLVGLICIVLGCFGPKNLQLLWYAYKREVVWSVLIAGVFYLFLTVVYALWMPLAAFVLVCVSALLRFSGLHAVVVPPNILMLDKFGITVAQYCSGIESIALFTGLYVVVGLLDWKRLYKKRYLFVFPFALALLFGLNILRVYGLIMAGYYINPQIAFSLFHTYAGTVFFILYSIVFWAIAYCYLLNSGSQAKTLTRKE
jgi:exosortase/archaeosortase family protein